MPQVTVKDQAFHDPRLRLASTLLSVSRATLGWELISIWSLATDRNSPIMKPELIGAALERDAELVIDAFVAADLADLVATDDLDLSPMASLFGDCHWLKRTKDNAPVAGQIRAQQADETGQRGPDGRFTAEPLRERVINCLRRGPRKRKQLREELRVRRTVMLSMVRTLIAEGVVVETADGSLVLASTLGDTGIDNTEYPVPERVPTSEPDLTPAPVPDTDPGTGNDENPVPGTRRREPVPTPEPREVPGPVPDNEYPVPPTGTGYRVPADGSEFRNAEPSALALAPSLSLARERRARTHACEGTESPGPTPEQHSLDSDALVPTDAGRRRVARLLWQYQNKHRQELNPAAPSPPLNDAPGGTLDPVIRALARYSPSQCRHALDVFAAEGACIAQDDGDPLEFLNGRTNWKAEQLDRAVVTTTEAIKKRFRTRSSRRLRNSAEPGRRLKKLN